MPPNQSLAPRHCKQFTKRIGDDGTPLKVAQKILTSTVGEREFSAQVTCHIILMLWSGRFPTGDNTLEEDKPVTVGGSHLNHYCAGLGSQQLENLTLLSLIQKMQSPKKSWRLRFEWH